MFEESSYNSYAKVKISERELQKNHSISRKNSPRKSELSVFYEIPVEHEELEEQHYVSEKVIFSKRNEQVEEVRLSGMEQNIKQPSNLAQFMETTDSFDSTYTKISEVSRNTVSVDLNKSSMEDFTIGSNESYESHESNQSNEDR